MKQTRKAVVVGAGQNGTQVCHILRHDASVEIIGFLDDDASKWKSSWCGLPVLGGMAQATSLRESGVFAGIVAVGHNGIRKKLSAQLEEAGLSLISAVHPFSCIDSPKSIGPACIIEMGVTIHPQAEIGTGVFLGGGSIVAHHCCVGDFALIGGGVTFGGGVTIGASAVIGVGTALRPGVKVGAGAVIGAGSAVVKDIPEHAVAVGVPAKVIRMLQPEEMVVR